LVTNFINKHSIYKLSIYTKEKKESRTTTKKKKERKEKAPQEKQTI